MRGCYRGLRQCRRAVGAILAAAPLVALSGCLSLGGRTTYVNESPETIHRIESLEFRVSTLERMLSPQHPPPPEEIYNGPPPAPPQ